MTGVLNWLIDGIAIAVVATVAIRLIPRAAASLRYLFWCGALAMVLMAAWTPHALSLMVPAHGDVVSPVAVTASRRTALVLPALPVVWLWMLAGGWVAVTVVRMTRLVHGLRLARRLADQSRELPASHVSRFPLFERVRASSRPVLICESDALRGACAVGYRRPRILLSPALASGLDAAAVETIVLHEYAHLRRYDDWVCAFQGVVLAVCGLHPAVWWVCRQLDVEREAACDRMVVAWTHAPLAYARTLGAAAEIVSTTCGVTPDAVPGASMLGAGLHARVVRVLETAAPGWWQVGGASVMASMALAATVGVTGALPPPVRVGSPDDDVMVEALVSGSEVSPLAPTFSTRVDGRDEDVPTPARVLPDVTRPRRGTAQGLAAQAPEPARPMLTEAAAELRADDVTSESVGAAPVDVRPVAPALAPLVTPEPPLDVLPAGPVRSAARLGSATGDAFSRAGQSVGRFFRNSGRAVTQRF